MISIPSTLRVASFARQQLRRNFGVCLPAAQKATDPIQQLFVEKVREYANKKKGSGGKLVDSTPQIEADLKRELEKVAKQFGGEAGSDMTKFPDFKFVEPKVDDIDLK